MSVHLFVDPGYVGKASIKHYGYHINMETLADFARGGGRMETQKIYGNFRSQMAYLLQIFGYDIVPVTNENRVETIIEDINSINHGGDQWIVIAAASPKMIHALRNAKKAGSKIMILGFDEFMHPRLLDTADFYVPLPKLFNIFIDKKSHKDDAAELPALPEDDEEETEEQSA